MEFESYTNALAKDGAEKTIRIAQLEAENKRLRDALKVYADPYSWDSCIPKMDYYIWIRPLPSPYPWNLAEKALGIEVKE